MTRRHRALRSRRAGGHSPPVALGEELLRQFPPSRRRGARPPLGRAGGRSDMPIKHFLQFGISLPTSSNISSTAPAGSRISSGLQTVLA